MEDPPDEPARLRDELDRLPDPDEPERLPELDELEPSPEPERLPDRDRADLPLRSPPSLEPRDLLLGFDFAERRS